MKVLITTSGTGSRLGELTKFTNKSLVAVGDKPTLTRIINLYPDQTEFIITVGHFGDIVREYIEIAHPECNVEFVEVAKFEGLGSSLGHSMLCASDLLQEPFVFHASDALLTSSPIPEPKSNWVGGAKRSDANTYSSFDSNKGLVTKFHEKGEIEYDLIHIGLVGIQEYEKFWSCLRHLYEQDPNDTSLNDVRALIQMKQQNSNFEVMEFDDWQDVGNVAGLKVARENFTSKFNILEKYSESIFFLEDQVIKYYSNGDICKNRIARAAKLGSLVPIITGQTKHFYSYRFTEGLLLSNILNEELMSDFLEWSKKNLWQIVKKHSDTEFGNLCEEFYIQKTQNRINEYIQKNEVVDKPSVINGLNIPSAKDLIDSLNLQELRDGIQGVFHGDLILDNVLANEGGFTLIDWRQDFSGDLDVGDIYYDLAKLNHNLTFNNENVERNLFELRFNGEEVICEIFRKNTFIQAEKKLHDFIKNNNYNLRKVKMITGIIWLNMAALHPHPVDKFLFTLGKLELYRSINQTMETN